MSHLHDKFRRLNRPPQWLIPARAAALALLLGFAVPAVGETHTTMNLSTAEVGDVTRIVDHLINTDLLDRLAENPDGLSIRLPENRRVYTVKLVGERLVIVTDSGETYHFLLKSLL